MQLAIFGGSGRAGRQVITQALTGGHALTALARDPTRLSAMGTGLKVVAGNVQDAAAVAETLQGAQAVISVLGPTRNEPVFEVSAGMTRILAAMKAQGVRRLIVSLGAGVADPRDTPQAFQRAMNFLVRRMARYVYEDVLRVDGLVRASGLDWTIVRVPMLTDGPRTGQVRAGYVGQGLGPRVSRADLADFMLKQLAADTYLRQAPAISN
jgi:putative NADH-flavin reductase